MTSYNTYPKQNIGSSDIASLTLRSPNGVAELNFGEDGSYTAYICDQNAEIGSHYSLILTAPTWLWIFDDEGLTKKFVGQTINVYRAKERGCIIQVINQEVSQ